ncbi:MAG TPA: DUF6314 family protein [Acidisoma sp.]|jgi:hypothetical protein|nr:DUF6314 family protein [Acidisoma sp.]HTI01979.1 DUF6314 family protein [Acidisoma sp.]
MQAGLSHVFQGEWRLIRRMRDRKRGEMGRLEGEARFTLEAPGMLAFEERGMLTLGSMRTEARRAYRYDMTETGFRVLFPDGRFFHEARLEGTRADVSHDCAPDLYRGRYRFVSPHRWWLSWRITGPRKDLVISSLFLRRG